MRYGHPVRAGALAALVLIQSCAPAPPEQNVRIVDLAGLRSALQDLKARITIVNFWATWCEPCVEEIPVLLEVARAHRADVALALVSYDMVMPARLSEERALALVGPFVKERGIDCPVFLYRGEVSALDDRFGLPGPLPATIVLDRQGVVVHRIEGQATRAQLEDAVALGAAKR